MDKYIEVADGHHKTAKQNGHIRIKMCDNNRKPFIATLHNILFAPDLCDRFFLIITFMSLGHNCLFHQEFCTGYLGAKENDAVTLPHSAQKNKDF